MVKIIKFCSNYAVCWTLRTSSISFCWTLRTSSIFFLVYTWNTYKFLTFQHYKRHFFIIKINNTFWCHGTFKESHCPYIYIFIYTRRYGPLGGPASSFEWLRPSNEFFCPKISTTKKKKYIYIYYKKKSKARNFYLHFLEGQLMKWTDPTYSSALLERIIVLGI